MTVSIIIGIVLVLGAALFFTRQYYASKIDYNSVKFDFTGKKAVTIHRITQNSGRVRPYDTNNVLEVRLRPDAKVDSVAPGKHVKIIDSVIVYKNHRIINGLMRGKNYTEIEQRRYFVEELELF